MQIITDINHINRNEWQQLISVSPTATWFQTPEAYDFFAEMPQILQPFICAVTNENAKLKGIIVGYVTKELNPIKQFFTRRAIINGGPLLANDISNEELTSLLMQVHSLLNKKAIYVETRNFHDFSKWQTIFETCGFIFQPHYDIHIACENSPFDYIHESKQRAIRKLLNDGHYIIEAQSKSDVHQWYLLLADLYKQKVHRPLFPEHFFVHGWESGICKLLLTKDAQNTITGGLFAPILQNKAIYEWYIVGNALSTWAGIKFATENQLQTFDLMGAGIPNKPYGVRDFKLQFGGKLKDFGRYTYIYKPLLYKVGTIVINNSNKHL